ncbi:MAG: NUDIX hydrolase [Pseudomonadota bacterium]
MSQLRQKTPRLAVRAVIVENDRLLMVNAWPDGKSDLLCAPGGGVEVHNALPDNLMREVYEETGLRVEVGSVCLVNEFHDPQGAFHQVDIYFRCTITQGEIDPTWQDPENIVTTRLWVTQAELAHLNFKPDSLPAVAFDPTDEVMYDPLEPLVR